MLYTLHTNFYVRENLPGHFKFKEYCPRVFHDLRKRFEVDDIDFMVSYCMCIHMCTGVHLGGGGVGAFPLAEPLPP